MGQVSGTCEQDLSFSDYVTAGKITPQTYSVAIASPGIAGAKINYTSGTGAGQVDGLYAYPVALAANTPQTFDLTSLTGLGGEALNFARARELIVFNADATAGHDVKVYQGASNGWAALPPPALPPGHVTATAVGSGGTFAAATYYWKVTATTAYGETTGSAETSAAIVANGSCALAWDAVPGATGYKVYRATTAGGESTSPAQAATIASGATTSYTDTGAAASAGSVPATSTAASAFPLWARASNGSLRLSDPSSTGAGNGQVVTGTSRTLVLDSGANAVTVYLVVAGGSAA